MDESSRKIPDEAIAEIRLACYQFADLYFHFCKVIVQEFGVEKGKDIIAKAVGNRAVERAQAMRQIAVSKGLPLTVDSWRMVSDVPRDGWVKSLGKFHCPYGEAWLARYAENPWFALFAEMYCNVNDPLITETFTGDMSQHITKNVLAGDDTCDREYFPMEKSSY